MSVHVSVDVLSGVPAYLWDPPTNSWVSSLASLFFILGLLAASPIFLLLALDFTSYAIVRTLGIEHAHPVSSKSTISITTTGTSPSSSSSTPSPVNEKAIKDTLTSTISSSVIQTKTPTSKRPKSISIPHPQSLTMDQVQPFFTTPGGANLELEGLFSPPESRTPSPPGSSSSFFHLDHQGGDGAQHISDQGHTPRLEATPASGTGTPAGVRRKGNDAYPDETTQLGVVVALGDNDSSSDVLGPLRRRNPVPGQSQN